MPGSVLAILAMSSPATAQQRGPSHYSLAGSESQARYHAWEDAAGPNKTRMMKDATGTTRKLTGQVALDANGRIVPHSSAILIDARSLAAEGSGRDRWIQNFLQMAKFPNIEFRPSSATGFDSGNPGTRDVEIAGMLVLGGVARPTTWRGKATVGADDIVGTVATMVHMTNFGLMPPVTSLLSLHDSLGLEFTFHFTKAK